MDVLRDVRERDQETPIFMLTAYGSVEAAVSALKLGANDFIPKVWDNEKLLIEIDREIARKRLERENTHLKRALRALRVPQHRRQERPDANGHCDLVAQVAPSRSTMLVTGETGTGKELIASAIHAQFAARRASVRSGQLGIAAAGPARIHPVRPCQGRFHERHAVKERLLRGRRQGHHLFRRDRHHRPGDADQAAARDAGARVHSAGLHRIRSVSMCASSPPPTPTCSSW